MNYWVRQRSKEKNLANAQHAGREAIATRDLAGLDVASSMDPNWICEPWTSDGGVFRKTLPLAQAARLGWVQGVSRLVSLGADAARGDDDRNGWGKGRSPLSEALARGDMAVANELVKLGAPATHLGDMLWAVGFAGHKRGLVGARGALEWAKNQGMDIWKDDEASKSAQSAFLFLGSLGWLGSGDMESLEIFERSLFEGYSGLPGASQCLWMHMLTVCDGSDKSTWICSKYLAEDPSKKRDLARELLAWSLMGGAAVTAGVASAEVGVGVDWESMGGGALEKACEKPIGEGGKVPKGARELAFEAAWGRLGPQLKTHHRDLQRACFKAMLSGNPEAFRVLLWRGDVSSEAVVSRWAKQFLTSTEVEHGRDSAAWHECHVELVAKVLSEPGPDAEERARTAWRRCRIDNRHGRGVTEVNEGAFANVLALAQNILLKRFSSDPGTPSRGSVGRRL